MGAPLYEIRRQGRGLRATVLLAVAGGMVLPIVAGLGQTLKAAFGLFPALGHDRLSVGPWRMLFELPGFWTSLRLSVVTGLGSTLIALILAIAVAATVQGRIPARRGARLLAPYLAAPHAAMAIGFAFLLAPSGWIARALALPLGWARPPDLVTVNDPHGVILILGLVVKEMPFLLLVTLSALSQVDARRLRAVGAALGYAPGMAWIKIVLPLVWPLIRLPVYVVLAYGLSTVDMAIILGPSNPPTLAVAVARWYGDPDPAMFLPASAGAILQGAVVIAAIAALWLGERVVARLALSWLRRGGRGHQAGPVLGLLTGTAMLLLMAGAAAMVSLVLWSFAWRWPFPALWPESWSLRAWFAPGSGLGRALANTLLIALVATALSLTLAVAWLEGEDRAGLGRAGWAEGLIYLPLLVPQIGFLYGLHVVFLSTGAMTGLAAVIWAQGLFVFPYVMIALSDPWRALDPRLIRAAEALGAGPWRRLFAVKLPVLLQPLLTAAAVGVAVSVAQYLPTLFLGAGRVPTLTTEAVTLSSGSDRRVTGAYATLQAVLPFACYTLAFLVPALLYRNRRDLSGAQ